MYNALCTVANYTWSRFTAMCPQTSWYLTLVQSSEFRLWTEMRGRFLYIRNELLMPLESVWTKLIFGKDSRYYLTFSYFFKKIFVIIFTSHRSSWRGESKQDENIDPSLKCLYKRTIKTKKIVFFVFSELISTLVYIVIIFHSSRRDERLLQKI